MGNHVKLEVLPGQPYLPLPPGNFVSATPSSPRPGPPRQPPFGGPDPKKVTNRI